MEEIWKPITEGDISNSNGAYKYYVSNLGRVKVGNWISDSGRQYKEHLVAQFQTKVGSQVVRLAGEDFGFKASVHILVAQAFIDNPNGHKSVIHLDGDKTNNCVDNLTWGKETLIRPLQSFSNRARPVRQYDRNGNFIREYPSAAVAARTLGMHVSGIYSCCSRFRGFRTAGGFVWRYSDDSDDVMIGMTAVRHKTAKRVRKLTEDGELVAEYSSVREAAKSAGVYASAMCRVLKSPGVVWRGFKWEYV